MYGNDEIGQQKERSITDIEKTLPHSINSSNINSLVLLVKALHARRTPKEHKKGREIRRKSVIRNGWPSFSSWSDQNSYYFP